MPVSRRIHWPIFALVLLAAGGVSALCRLRFDTTYLEIVAFLTSVIWVYLMIEEQPWNWPFGIVTSGLYAWVCYDSGLPADMSLQIAYVPLLIHGWYSWVRGGNGGSELPITRLTVRQWPWVVGGMAFGLSVYFPISIYFHSVKPLADSALTVASIVGQVLQNRKFLENWLIWAVIDAAYVPLWLSQKLVPTAILYAALAALAVAGHLNWLKLYRSQGAAAAA